MALRRSDALQPYCSERWRLQADRLPIRCGGDGHDRHDRHLCRECAEDLRLVLEDVPALITDLQVALTRETSFVEHGRLRSGEDDDEDGEGRSAPLPFDPRASAAFHRLAEAFGAQGGLVGPVVAAVAGHLANFDALLLDPGVEALAERVSGAVLHGYRVVDRPPDLWYYGPCPKCRVDIWDERNVEHVSCGHCSYAAPAADHQLASLDAGDDRLLTVGELVGAITAAGEPVTRHQINGWIKREGLVRELDNRVVWKGGQLVNETAYVYRLGDVRRLAREADERRGAA